MVEFALVAPIVLLLIGATVDFGRGVLLYSLLAGASRDTGRQATLVYYSGSNTLPPDCSALAAPCGLKSLVSNAHLLDALGVSVIYLDSSAVGSPPPYGTLTTYTPNGVDPTQPGTIAITGATNNTVYVFIYELDAGGSSRPRFFCPALACANSINPTTGLPYGGAARTAGNHLVVVDLKLLWQPVLARFLGIPSTITFDSQTVDRMEF